MSALEDFVVNSRGEIAQLGFMQLLVSRASFGGLSSHL